MAVSLMKYLLRSTRGTCGKRRVIKLSNVRQPSPVFSFPPEKLIPPAFPPRETDISANLRPRIPATMESLDRRGSR